MPKFEEHILIWEKHSQKVLHLLDINQRLGKALDMQDIFLRFTLDATGEILFGVSTDSLDQKDVPFAKAFDYVQSVCEYRSHPRGMWTTIFPHWGLERAAKFIRTFAKDIVQKCLDDPNLEHRRDLLAHVIRTKDDTITNTYLEDMTLNFLVAGRDTTGVLLTWTFYFLQR